MASIFTRLIRGELPSYEIYRDEDIFAFLDIRPLTLGHTLVVPIQEIDHITQMPKELYLKVMETAQHLSKGIHKATGSKRVGLIVQGFEVPHFHVHIVPINRPGDMSLANAKARTKEEMEMICRKIRDEIEER